MRALFDISVLIPIVDEDHVHFERARLWWAQNRQNGWATCPLTQNGLVRILSQPNYASPVSVAAAFGLLQKAIVGGDHVFWPDDLSLLDAERIDRDKIQGPKQLTDIYLLALAVKNGGCLATFDRAIPIAAVRGAETRHVVQI